VGLLEVGQIMEVLQKHAKGARPHFFDDPSIDKVLAMLMALAGEVSVLHDRQDTVERLLEEQGLLRRETIDQYQPSSDVMKERDRWRAIYLQQILRILDAEISGAESNDTSKEWQAVIDSVVSPAS
jgi:hypothetical protein